MFRYINTVARSIAAAVLAFSSLAIVLESSVHAFAVAKPASNIAIAEVQTGGCTTMNPCTEDPKQEFIRLYNTSTTPTQLQGWKLQYVSSSGSTVTDLTNLDINLLNQSSIWIAHTGYMPQAALRFGTDTDTGKLAKSGGAVRLVNATGQVVDAVGWGTASNLSPWQVLAAPNPGYSIQRTLIADSTVVDDARYMFSPPAVFVYTETPNPVPTIPDEPVTPPVTTPPPEPTSPPTLPTAACSSLQLSELLPNPSGTDTGHEFIELYNPTDQSISLAGCTLQTSSSSKKYELPNAQISALSYMAIGNDTSGLTLLNANGTVWLLAGSTELDTTTYGQTMDDDIAWALLDGIWQATDRPTPSTNNLPSLPEPEPAAAAPIATNCPVGQERNPATNRCRAVTPAVAAAVNCKAGQERNPETNRCRNIPTAPSAACKAGEVRNTATNRCNKVTATAAKTTACKAGQVRNPETGKCKAAAAATTKKPCPAGQIRNPETGRCKKDLNASAQLASVKDVHSPVAQNTDSRLLLIGVALAVAVAYAAYEWRQEIRLKMRSVIAKLSRRDASYIMRS